MPSSSPTPRPEHRWIDAVDIRLGTWLAAGGILIGLAYCLLTSADGNRPVMIGLLVLGLVSSFAVTVATPWLLSNQRRAEIFFPSWSTSYVLMIAVLSVLDGGADSPVRAFFFVPVAFAALAYPVRPAMLVAVTTVVSFVLLSLVHDAGANAGALVVGGSLASVAALGSYQARRESERRAVLTAHADSLRDSEQRFRSGFEHSPVGMALIASDGRYVDVNDALCRMLGRSRAELESGTFIDVTHPDDRAYEAELMRRFVADELDHVRHDKRYVRPDGEIVWASIGESVVRNPDGSVRYFHTHAMDVTHQRESERSAHRRAAQQAAVAALGQAALAGLAFNDLLEEAVEATATGLGTEYSGVAELLPDGQLVARYVRGWDSGVVLPTGSAGTLAGLALATEGPIVMGDAQTEQRFLTGWYQERGLKSALAVPVPNVGEGWFGVLGAHSPAPDFFDEDDVSFMQAVGNVLAGALAREGAERLLRHQSLHDSLTGLPNRALLLDRLGHALSRAERTDEVLAVLFLDVDHFKTVNDAFGHNAGDELLRVLTPRLQRALRVGDTLARFGGDEFVVLCEGLYDPRDAVLLAERLLAVFQAPFVLGTDSGRPTEHHLSASIGVAVAGPEHDNDPDSLIRDADTAMYRAKRSRGRVEIFDQHTRARVLARVQTTSELRTALDRDELFVAYQPIVGLTDGSIERVEALVRWDHPTRGTVSPAEFIPLAEESGLILPLGEWVLDRMLEQLAAWDAGPDSRLQGMRGAINLSARQLVEPGVSEFVTRMLKRHGIAPHRLVCEITETALIDDPLRAAENVEALHDAGVLVSLDDFCTGYSALEHLKRFPLSAIKLDRTFVAELATNPADMAIVRGLVEIAGAMNLSTVAEGVESPEQLARLREVGCEMAQGYLFAPPLSPDGLAAFIRGLPGGSIDLDAMHARVAAA